MSDNKIKTYNYSKAAAMAKLDARWWASDKHEVAQNVQAVVNKVEEQQTHERLMRVKYARLYSNLDLLGFIHGHTNLNRPAAEGNRVTFNVVKSVIDAVTSKIAKNKPKVQFLTEDGGYSMRQRAKNLTKYVEGVYYDCQVYKEAVTCFIHACVFGTGALKVYKKQGKIKVESIFIDELRIDNLEGTYGKPRQIHQVKHVAKEVLMEMYPEFAGPIADSQGDMVKVIESWHLPSGPDAGDGRHCITIENHTLFDEEYKKSYFPFVFLRWTDKLAGFFGQGIAEELIGIQIEINKILKNIQKGIHLVAVPRIGIDTGTKVSPQTITNEIGSMFKFSGKPPQFFTPQAMNAEVYNHLERLIRYAYEVTGVSQLSATSKKPSGLDAAVAMREYQDIETERFMITAQRYEQLFIDLAYIVIDFSRDLYTQDKNLKVKTQTNKFVETIKWKDVALEDSQFVMKAFPVSLLPQTPAGRLQKIQELIQAGFISQDQALSLLDFPDLDRVQSLEMASLKLTNKQLAMIVEDLTYSEPEPSQNLDQALKLAQQTYLKAKLDDMGDETLELLLRYIDDVERLIGLNQEGVDETVTTEEVVEDLPQ